MTTRRLVLSRSAAIVGAASTGLLLPQLVRAQSNKVRVGLMLPYTGTFAQLGVAIENGMRMAIDEKGGKLGGREIEWFKVDDESDPAKAVENANRLVQRDKVDVIVGTVHSGVQMGIQRVARESGVLSLIPNAGAHAATRALCAPNVFRTSFTNSQPTLALGKKLLRSGADALVIVTEWDEFRALDLDTLAGRMRGRALVDLRNVYDREEAERAGFDYSGIGHGAPRPAAVRAATD